jgi:hypothetical protein
VYYNTDFPRKEEKRATKFCNRQYERALTRVICKSLGRVKDATLRHSVCLLADTYIYKDEKCGESEDRDD